MKIDDYVKLALDNGLVVMQIDQPLSPYKVGSYAGFTPEDAMFYHQEGIAHPKDGPREYPQAPPEPPPPGPALVEIPPDWRQLNRLQKVHIAAKIHGTLPQVSMTNKEAEDAIQIELNRREVSAGAAQAQAFPAVTAASLPR